MRRRIVGDKLHRSIGEIAPAALPGDVLICKLHPGVQLAARIAGIFLLELAPDCLGITGSPLQAGNDEIILGAKMAV